jgi:integrase
MGRQSTRYPNIYRRGSVYYFRFRDEGGRWRERRYGASLEGTRRAQIQAQNEADAVAARITTREHIDQRHAAATDFAQWLTRYDDHLKAKGVTEYHRRACLSRCRAAAAILKIERLGDVTPRAVEAMLDAISTAGASVRTRNDYLVKLSAFLNWALPANPLAKMKPRPTAADSRRPARALTPAEFEALLESTPNPRRQLAYLIAGRTGLRWSEMRKIQWSQIDLDAGTIIIRAADAKNRREQVIAMPMLLVQRLREIPAKIGPVMPHPPIRRTWMEDIARAGITHVTDAGQADRRCLRKTFVTHLALSGVDLRTAQRMARHSSPNLTANIYTDPALLDMQAAAAALNGLNRKAS